MILILMYSVLYHTCRLGKKEQERAQGMLQVPAELGEGQKESK
mgnify:FL=1